MLCGHCTHVSRMNWGKGLDAPAGIASLVCAYDAFVLGEEHGHAGVDLADR